MEEYLKFLVTPLLGSPQDLSIKTTDSSIVVKVAETDTGRVIGKHGNVINALRTLLRTYCTLHQLPPPTLILNSPPLPPAKSTDA